MRGKMSDTLCLAIKRKIMEELADGAPKIRWKHLKEIGSCAKELDL
jgi:hypothetical protein